jgi:hypothetical protein
MVRQFFPLFVNVGVQMTARLVARLTIALHRSREGVLESLKATRS